MTEEEYYKGSEPVEVNYDFDKVLAGGLPDKIRTVIKDFTTGDDDGSNGNTKASGDTK